jgi:hypothetical protein
MVKRATEITIEEKPGDKYPDLRTVQQLAKCSMAVYLAAAISDLQAQGMLVVKDGKVIPNPEKVIIQRELLSFCFDE